MTKATKSMILVAAIVTLATLVTWMATGRDYYTKYQVVEQVEVPIDQDDPFAQTGFQDDDKPLTETITRDEFHLGLIPTPSGLLDKHAVSVLSISAPPWGLAVLLFVMGWMRKRKSAAV